MSKIIIDPGHGGADPGACGNGLQEKDINLTIGIALAEKMAIAWECEILLTRHRDLTVSLSRRTEIANNWEADFFLSLHVNGFHNTAATGYEDFTFSGNIPQSTVKIQQVVHRHVSQVWVSRGRANRGMKRANFHVLRETKMDALLIEHGFISNPQDAALLVNSFFQSELINAMAAGLGEALNLKSRKPVIPEIPDIPADRLYRVCNETYSSREAADAQVDKLKEAGFNAWIQVIDK